MHDVARTPAIDELDIAALGPAQGLKCLPEYRDPRLSFQVIRDSHQNANPPHAIKLLRVDSKRPSHRAAQKGHEVASLHIGHGPSSRPGSDHQQPT